MHFLVTHVWFFIFNFNSESEAEVKHAKDSYRAMSKELQSAEDEKSAKIKTIERTNK